MTLEELQAELEELKNGNEALNSKNRELLGELKKERSKNKEVDIEAHYKLQEDFEALKDNYSKLEKTYKGEVTKLQSDLQSKDSYLEKVTVDSNLSKVLLDNGVDKTFLDDAILHLKQKAKIVKNGNDYEAMIEDKSLNDFIPTWVNDYGKKYVMKTVDTGGGARGGTTTGTQKSFKDMNEGERVALYKQDPAKFEELAGQTN